MNLLPIASVLEVSALWTGTIVIERDRCLVKQNEPLYLLSEPNCLICQGSFFASVINLSLFFS